MPNYPGWGFFKFNPWRPKFDQLIRHRAVNEPSQCVERDFNKEKERHCKIRGGSLTALIRQHIEAGLVDEWKWRTWRRMKEEAIARGDVLQHEEASAVAALTLADITSPLLFMGLCFGLATLMLISELVTTMCIRKQ